MYNFALEKCFACLLFKYTTQQHNVYCIQFYELSLERVPVLFLFTVVVRTGVFN